MSSSAATQPEGKLVATAVEDRVPADDGSLLQSTEVPLSPAAAAVAADAAAESTSSIFPSTPSYRGEAALDTPTVVPLKRTELWAWYVQNATYCAYGWVSAVMLVPLLVQDVAAKNGVETRDHSVACDTTQPNYSCVMRVFGNHYLDPGTISLYISSLSAIVSFIVSLSIAAIADHGVLEATEKAATAARAQAPSMLPLSYPSHTKELKDSESSSSNSNSSSGNHTDAVSLVEAISPLSHPSTGPDVSANSTAEQRKVEEQVSNDLSAWCYGASNMGALIVQGTCIGISLGMGNTLLSLQIAIAFTGVWWLVWTIAVLPWLDARPGPPLPKGHNWIAYSWSKSE
ncbi:Autophagy protein 22 [Mortierella alpina]|nr:Autophagy protein 22 [Mortierella alpina]